MSKFQAALDLYTKELKDKAGVTADADLLKSSYKSLWSFYLQC